MKNITPQPVSPDSVMYECINCGTQFPITKNLYTCPNEHDGSNLLEIVLDLDSLKEMHTPDEWKQIFKERATFNDPSVLNDQALHGVFRFAELVNPLVSLEDIIYLGEGNTPVIRPEQTMQAYAGVPFEMKHDGLQPSLSFKDRGMVSAVTFMNYLIRTTKMDNALGICASTGDTSASAALYCSYLTGSGNIKSAVLLPQGKVTPAQLAQPLAAGATVIELPGVFDDCMKIVEQLADKYPVFLLNSKNPWRIQGQKTFAYECAERWNYDMKDKVVVVPVGNAGNLTSVLEGFLDLYDLLLIDGMPKVVGVQSQRANPVKDYYKTGEYKPVDVIARGPSAAQAAYIGNPVSFPRVKRLVDIFRTIGGEFHMVDVGEQEIMDTYLLANSKGLTACTQGAEAIAGLKAAVSEGMIDPKEHVIVDSTSHHLKFMDFQLRYYQDNLRLYGVVPAPQYANKPNPVDLDLCAVEKALGLQ